jgi:hypothetical protein
MVGMRPMADVIARSVEDADEVPLFSRVGHPPPVVHSPDEAQQFRRYLLDLARHGGRSLPLRLISAGNNGITFLPRQLTLPFDPPRRPNVVRIVPPIRRAFLDYGVYDQFCEEPKAARAALKLESSGVFVLGQLLQMSEERVRAFPFINDAALETMKANLKKVDLCFGMRDPQWNRRMRSVVAISL